MENLKLSSCSYDVLNIRFDKIRVYSKIFTTLAWQAYMFLIMFMRIIWTYLVELG